VPIEIHTTRFGPFTVNDEDIIRFPQGIPGFETHKEWAITGEDDNPVKWLQSLADGDVALPVTHPTVLMKEYAPRFADEDLETVRCGEDKNLVLLIVLAIPEGNPWDMTANLRAPLIINHVERVGVQVIAMNEEYALRHPVFHHQGNGEEPVTASPCGTAEDSEDGGTPSASSITEEE